MIWLAPVLQALALTGALPAATANPPPPALASPLPAATPPPAVMASPAPALPTGPEPIFTRQALFAIPFHIERPVNAGQEAVEVQLYVSGDRGARWDLYKKMDPRRQQFLFRAGTDGEFWFCVLTLDRSGQLRPAGSKTPGLKVVVDTAPPKLQIDARRGDVGQVTVGFRIDEAYPKFESFAIQYRTDNSSNWQTVAVGQRDIRTSGTRHEGDVTLWPPAGAGSMEIRAQLTDMAGNPADSRAQLLLSPSPGPGAGAAPGNPAAAGPATPITPPSDAFQWPDAPKTTGPDPPEHWRPEDADPRNRPGVSTAAVQPSGPPVSPLPAANRPPEVATAPPTMATIAPATGPSAATVAIRVNPPVGSEVLSPHDSSAHDARSAPQTSSLTIVANRPPASEPIHWVNSLSFAVEYSTESVGPSGVGKVELWGTRDGGQTWRSLGIDPKHQSPMHVTVNEPGVYGFRIAVQNGAGRGGKPPLSGDRPEVWIGIDLQSPTVRNVVAQQGAGAESDRIIIQWEASDNERLTARPIALSFSPMPGGPWTVIAKDLENNGRFNWSFDDRVPARVYLRVEARDEAGNVGRFDLPQPIAIDRSATMMRLRPQGQSTEKPLEGHWWR